MVSVIADTSPLNYLAKIGQQQILRALYETVTVPQAVLSELSHAKAPLSVRTWLDGRPSWLLVADRPQTLHPDLRDLGAGEAEAIALGRTDVQLLMDDGEGRRVAASFRLRVIGTLGILQNAAGRGLLDLREAVAEVRAAGLYVSDKIVADVLR